MSNNNLRVKLDKIAYVVSVCVLILVGLMRRLKFDVGIDFSFLPPVNAIFNIIVSIFLILALFFVKKKDIQNHRKMIFCAMIFSAFFLLTYVLYHFTTEETKYCHEGWQRTVYFTLLITHIVLAGISLPFILLTFNRGFTNQIDKHIKMARIVYPVWLFVAISGPVCYLMLRSCY